MPSSTAVPNGLYRIRKAGAKSQIAIEISNGKKCHYVQIGIELTRFDNLEDAMEFVEGKELQADPMSLDFGMKKEVPAEEKADEPVETESSD